ncbi:MAG: lytic transglycosylase domain-containing protein [Bernardetiaceae bacterium]|nr:lytic transglycosylase domain-containing protein [Bernardetiaceae bacterium]
MIKISLQSFGSLLLGLFIVFFSLSANAQRVYEAQTVVLPELPATVSFAGEVVPLSSDIDLRDRLHFELAQNIYFHSKTLMLLKRMYRWKKVIQEELEAQQIHPDFFYLAVAESELDPNARSHMGAVGIWQFMPQTAKEFGLEQQSTYDMRRDPLASTQAACKYFKQAYKKFGNWTSVAASYNRGMYGLQQAFDMQKVDSYYDLYLNKETSRYVFRILALKIILQDPAAYGFCLDLQDYDPPYEFTTYKVEQSIYDLPQFALDCSTNYKTLKLYNPAIEINNKKYELIIPAGKTFYLRLPKGAKLPKQYEAKMKKVE